MIPVVLVLPLYIHRDLKNIDQGQKDSQSASYPLPERGLELLGKLPLALQKQR